MQKYSDDFYENFGELIQNTDQLFPKTLDKLNEKVSLVNKALIASAEENIKPRELIDRTFIMPDKIKEKFESRDRLNVEKKFKEAIRIGK